MSLHSCPVAPHIFPSFSKIRVEKDKEEPQGGSLEDEEQDLSVALKGTKKKEKRKEKCTSIYN